MHERIAKYLSASACIAACVIAAASAVAATSSQQALSIGERILLSHNLIREKHRLAPLRWNAELEDQARDWAMRLSREDRLFHADKDTRRGRGENLWRGSKDHYKPEDMIAAFEAEGAFFRPGVFPEISHTGNWQDVGHYTQIVWPETIEVGCAVARSERDDYLVCRYYPAGNIAGVLVK